MNGIEMIAAERDTHDDRGHDTAHDQQHGDSELIAAAICYSVCVDMPLLDPAGDVVANTWPWRYETFNPEAEPLRNLAIAGSLLAAEIDRRLAVEARLAGQAEDAEDQGEAP